MGELPAVVRAFLAFACLSCFGAAAHADSVSPYRAPLSTRGIEAALRTHSRSPESEAISPVRIHGRVFGAGNIDVRFSRRQGRAWPAVITRNGKQVPDPISPVLLRGGVAFGGSLRMAGRRTMPSAGYIVGNTLRITFAGRARGSRKSRQRIYTITMRLDGSIVIEAKVASIPRSAVRRGACGAPTARASSPIHAFGDAEIVKPLGDDPGAADTESARVVTLSTDADPEWYARYGEESNAVIAGLVNAGEAIYARQLGMRFRIVKQHAYADGSPYTSTDALKILSAFTSNPENAANLSDAPRSFNQDVDIKHLFTGKDIDGTIIGIAYIGVVCSSPTLAYGVTSHYVDAADFAIFAHEVGHNFGANHDSTTAGTLMYPSISIPPAERLSDISLKEMNEHFIDYGSCVSVEQVAPRPDLTPGYPTPTPPPDGPDLNTVIIRIKKTRVGDPRDPVVRVSGRVLSAAGAPLPGVSIRLYAAGETVDDIVSDSAGSFRYFVRLSLPQKRQIYLWAETMGGEVYSNFIWLGKTQPR